MITKDEIERELKLAKDPKRQLQIIAQLNGVSVQKIKSILNGEERSGKPGRPFNEPFAPIQKYHRWTENELADIRAMREAGYMTIAIADKYGVPLATMSSLCVRHRFFYNRGGKNES